MGLFWTDAGAASRAPADNISRKKIVLTESTKRHLSCQTCPNNGKKDLYSPRMEPSGSDRPIFYLLGESPSKVEDENGEHFSGDSGRFVKENIPPEYDLRIRFNNVVRCRSIAGRDPSPIEVESCRRLLVADIEKTKPEVIVGFGALPLKWMLGDDRAINNWRGRRVPVQIGSHVCWYYTISLPSIVMSASSDKKKGEATVQAFRRDVARVFADYESSLSAPYIEPKGGYFDGVECLYEFGAAGLATLEQRIKYFRDVDHGMDIETNGLRPYFKERKILSVAVSDYESTFCFGWGHREAKWSSREQKRIYELMEWYVDGSGRKWCHKLSMEQEWFQSYYGPKHLLFGNWGDTLGQAHVIDSRVDKALDDLTRLHFGFRIKSLSNVDVANLDAEPLVEVLPYNSLDAKYCFALSVVQGGILEETDQQATYELMSAATPGLVLMQARGTLRDVDAAVGMSKKLNKEIEDTKLRIMEQKDVAAFRKTGQTFSPTSGPNLISFFKDYLRIPHPTLKPPAYNVDEPTLSAMKHPVASMILEIRSTQKNLGYVTPLLDGGKYVHQDGMIHAQYNNYITSSGRLACSDPNQQNYPRRKHKEIRRVVVAPPGYKFVAADYAQLEWRIGAMLSKDPTMSSEIWEGGDIHGEWTDEIGQLFVPKKVKESRKKVRDSIKQYWTFANLYGQVLSGLAWDLSQEFNVDISVRELEPFFNKFWGKYPKLKKYQDDLMLKYWELGYVETGTGFRRYEPLARNEVINHPFQGTAGHLVINAQSRISVKAFEEDRPYLQPIMNIHDDLSFLLPVASLEQDIEDIARVMCTSSFPFASSVPLAVEFKVGDNWCDTEEIATLSTKDFL